ncbi:MAG: phage portal protein [Bacteroidia bacterium]
MRILGIDFGSKRIQELENELRSVTTFVGRFADYAPAYKGVQGVGKIAVNEQSSLRLSAVWACVRLISNSIATLPSNFHVRDSNGDSTIDNSISAQSVIKNPNQYMSSFTFKFTMMACKLLHGNGFAIIERDSNGKPLQLIPIHPKRVEVKVEDGEIKYFIDENKIAIDYNNILHFKGVTTDGIKGMSTIESEAENLGLGLASQNELKQFYEKGSKIDGFVSYPNKFESGAKIKAEEALTKKVSGTEPTTKIPIFDNGAKFVQVGVNPAEALWLDMMGYAVEDIARIFGAPPHKIGALRQSTNNNIEQQSMDYVNDCLLPHAKEMEEELERKLLNSDEKINHFFKFNFNGLLRGDSQARASLYNSLFQNGGITPNQICKLEDLPTFEGGDEHYVQLNMISVTNAASYYQTLQTDKTAKRMEIEDILEIIEKRNLTKV